MPGFVTGDFDAMLDGNIDAGIAAPASALPAGGRS
jgi:hypothetical protein